MRKIGLLLMKNSTSMLALYFLGWAIWACINWEALCLVQKLVMGMFLLLVLHEYEEAYKGRFVTMMGRVIGFTSETLPISGLIHVPADTFIAILFTFALIFPNQLWLVFATILLGFLEMAVHNWGIVMFRLKGVSPGWYTAMLQGVFGIYALLLINHHIDYNGIHWLWAALYLILGFALLECLTLGTTGKPFSEIKSNVQTFLINRFEI